MSRSENGDAPAALSTSDRPHTGTEGADDNLPRGRRPPVALITTGVLVILIALGAASTGPLHFGSPRWNFGGAAKDTPPAGGGAPTLRPTPTKAATARTSASPDLTWVAILIGALALAFVIFLVIRWLRGRQRDRIKAVPAELDDLTELDDLPLDPSVETGLPYLRRGLRRALIVLDENRDPSDAIIQAWLGLQESAEDAGFQRQSAETPTEFTTRILKQLNVDRRALDTLRRLYLAVRFGDAQATADDIASARQALLTLDAQWESQERQGDNS